MKSDNAAGRSKSPMCDMLGGRNVDSEGGGDGMYDGRATRLKLASMEIACDRRRGKAGVLSEGAGSRRFGSDGAGSRRFGGADSGVIVPSPRSGFRVSGTSSGLTGGENLDIAFDMDKPDSIVDSCAKAFISRHAKLPALSTTGPSKAWQDPAEAAKEAKEAEEAAERTAVSFSAEIDDLFKTGNESVDPFDRMCRVWTAQNDSTDELDKLLKTGRALGSTMTSTTDFDLNAPLDAAETAALVANMALDFGSKDEPLPDQDAHFDKRTHCWEEGAQKAAPGGAPIPAPAGERPRARRPGLARMMEEAKEDSVGTALAPTQPLGPPPAHRHMRHDVMAEAVVVPPEGRPAKSSGTVQTKIAL